LRWTAFTILLLGIAGLVFSVLPPDVLQSTGWFKRDLSYRNATFIFYFGVIYCAGSIFLALLSFFLARKGMRLWVLALLIFASGAMLYQGTVQPYKAAVHFRKDLGLELKQVLGGKTDHLTVYKFRTMPGLYTEGHYMGGRIVTVNSERELPSAERVIYVLSPEVPSVPDRTWRSLFNKTYRKQQRLILWRGELRDYEENDR